MHVCMHSYVYVCIYAGRCMYVPVYVSMYACMRYVCMHTYVYMCMCVCVHRYLKCKITRFALQIATQLKGIAIQMGLPFNNSQYVYIKFLGVANHFLTWLANSANHIFRIILHLDMYVCMYMYIVQARGSAHGVVLTKNISHYTEKHTQKTGCLEGLLLSATCLSMHHLHLHRQTFNPVDKFWLEHRYTNTHAAVWTCQRIYIYMYVVLL